MYFKNIRTQKDQPTSLEWSRHCGLFYNIHLTNKLIFNYSILIYSPFSTISLLLCLLFLFFLFFIFYYYVFSSFLSHPYFLFFIIVCSNWFCKYLDWAFIYYCWLYTDTFTFLYIYYNELINYEGSNKNLMHYLCDQFWLKCLILIC